MKENINSVKPETLRTIGNLPIIEAKKFIGKIPLGSWQISDPIDDLKIETSDSRALIEYKKRTFRSRYDKIFEKWVNFCDLTQKAYNAESNLKKNHEIIQNFQGSANLKIIHSVMFSKINKENNLSKLINSCRMSFLGLLSKDARKRMGIKMRPRINNEDMENTRFLIKGLANRLIIKG